MLDLHSHILFGIDDGARTREETLEMLRAAHNIGITAIVATPHARDADIQFGQIYQTFCALLPDAESYGIKLILGYEFNARLIEHMGIEVAQACLIEKTNSLLLELPYDKLPLFWEYWVSDLARLGIAPIIAHVERIREVRHKPELAYRFVQLGCTLQVDAESLLVASHVDFIQWLCKNDIPFILASDAHRPDFYRLFAHAVEYYPNAKARVDYFQNPHVLSCAPLSSFQKFRMQQGARKFKPKMR